MKPHPAFKRIRTSHLGRDLAIAVLFGAAVCLGIWGSATLRLDVDGRNYVWLAVAAFGLAFRALPGQRSMRAACFAAGATAGIIGFFASALLLPLAPLGRGIGLGATATIVFVVARLAAQAAPVSVGMALLGLGAGMAVVTGTDLSSTTGWAEVGAMVTATVLATALGTLGSELLERIGSFTRRRAVRSGESRTTDAPAMDERSASAAVTR